MSSQAAEKQSTRPDQVPGVPLSPWAYCNNELLDLEYEAFFLRRWQLAGHVCEVPNVGDFLTLDLGRDNIAVLRGKDHKLRAFLNVCRHRASRVFEGSGNCRGVVRCPYHGWTYRLDGTLMSIPQDCDFPAVDRASHGLHEIELEEFHGFIFVRVTGDGPSLADHFAHTARYFEMYDSANYEMYQQRSTQIWNVNWKVAWDNYLENYHIPLGHPGLNRLLRETDDWEELDSGVSYGMFEVKDKLSKVPEERQYQELFGHACKRVPEELRGLWVQFGLAGNLGIDFYPELVDIFQIVPLAVDKTLVVAMYYGHPDPSPEMQELRRLNILINDSVNEEDRQLCTRVQQGLRSYGYSPGPLSQQESGVFAFHEMVRRLIPVTSLAEAPAPGTLASENSRLLARA